MFLNQLYNYNKAWFLLFVFFILSFLFINYKGGMVASPVYVFGMFSGPVHLPDTQHVYVISVNDRKVIMSNYSFVEKDMMLVMPEKYLQSRAQNLHVYETMNRLFSKAGLGNFHHRIDYINRVDDAGFSKWYINYLATILNEPVTKFELSSQFYIWKGNKIQAVGPLHRVPSISSKF